MLLRLLLLFQFIFCSGILSCSHTFDFIIHRNIKDNFESYFRFKFEAKPQLCYGSPLACTNFFISPDSLYTWVQNSSYVHRRRVKRSGDPHSDDYGQFYLKNELVWEVYSFKDRIEIGFLSSSNITLIFSEESKDPQIHASIGLLKSIPKLNYKSFLEQLYAQNGVDKEEFTIQYLNKTAGRITFGGSARNPKSLLYEFEIQSFSSDIPQLIIMIDKLSFNKKMVNQYFRANIDESFGFIQCPSVYSNIISQFKDIFNEYFIEKQYRKLSQNGVYWQNTTYYVCNKSDKETILKKLPEITFSFVNFSILLKKENMLVEYENNQMIFAMVFTSADLDLLKSLWILGEPFLKEYDIQHNFEEKRIKLYQRKFMIGNEDAYIDKNRSYNVECYMLLIVSLIGIIVQLITSFQVKQSSR